MSWDVVLSPLLLLTDKSSTTGVQGPASPQEPSEQKKQKKEFKDGSSFQ
jgi:hypothetical protein